MRPVASRPRIILRTVQPDAVYLPLEHLNGHEARLTRISMHSGPDGGFHCEIETPEHPIPMTLSSNFLEVAGDSFVPVTHKEPRAAQAWLLCSLRDQAWRDQFYAAGWNPDSNHEK